MQVIFPLGAASGLLVAALVLSGCGEAPPAGRDFQSQYAVARNALESGDFARANRAYMRLLPQAGPLSPRIRLEYAHSQLRAGDYAAAATAAGELSGSSRGAARSAALAVQGTAEHEIALALLAKGDTAGGKAHLTAAAAALDEVLANNPEFDPLGSLAGRKASIGVRLRGL